MSHEGKLFLIGTHHLDTQGFYKLATAFKHLAPRYLTVEEKEGTQAIFDEQLSRSFITAVINGKVAEKLGLTESDIGRVYSGLLSYSYEKKFASTVEKAGVPVHRIDKDFPDIHDAGQVLDLSQEPDLVNEFYGASRSVYDKMVEEGFPIGDITRTGAFYVAMTFFSEENMNKIIDYEYNNLPAKYNGSTKSEERDVVMSERLRELRQNNEGNGMHIGGVSHMFGNYHNLYERLADLSPTRYRLSEFSPTIFS